MANHDHDHDHPPSPWQAWLIFVGAAIVGGRILRLDQVVRLLIGATRTAWTLRTGEAWIIGAVEAQYGPFRLHRLSLRRKDGTTRREPYLMVVIGALATPVGIPLAQMYAAWQEFDETHGVVSLGTIIRRTHSAPCDVYRAVRQWQATEDAARAQRAKPFTFSGLDRLPPDTQARLRAQAEAPFRAENARAAARAPVVDAALREFAVIWRCH